MVKIEILTLILNKEIPVYNPDEIINGFVEVKLSQNDIATPYSLVIYLNGKANVHWYMFENFLNIDGFK